MKTIDANDIAFVLSILGLTGIIFGIYKYFRDPQIKSDKFEALLKQNLEFLTKEFAGRFSSIDKEITNLKENHIHTLYTKVDTLTTSMNNINIELGKLSTIIDERIPKK